MSGTNFDFTRDANAKQSPAKQRIKPPAKVGRPSSPTDEKRDRQLSVYLTASEYDEVMEQYQNVNLSGVMRELLMAKVAEARSDREMIEQLKHGK